MTLRFEASLAIDSHDGTGEGPVWDMAGQRLVWSDNHAGLVREARADDKGVWQQSAQWSPTKAISVVLPRASGGLVVVGGTEISFLDDRGITTAFVDLDIDASHAVLNDGKCDRRGRLWTGTMATDFTTPRGALYRIDPDGVVTEVLNGVLLSNGLDWSPDEAVFYYIDSGTGGVDAFDHDPISGTIGNRRRLVTIPYGEGVPDGMCVDAEGCLWVAIYGAGEVRRFSPHGVLLGVVEVAVPAVTSCAFGGRMNAELFITTAGARLPNAALPLAGFDAAMADRFIAPVEAGGLFVCRPGAFGRPATPFAS